MRSHHCRSCKLTTGSIDASAFSSSDSAPHYPPHRSLEPIHLDLVVRISIEKQELEVCQVWTVRARSAGHRSLTFDGVNLHQVEAELPQGGNFDYNGQHLQLNWQKDFQAGEERLVQIRYTVQSPVSGVRFSAPTNADSEPNTAAAQFAITDHETERARHWLLCVDHPSVRPTLSIQLRAPTGLTLLANGAITNQQIHEDGTHSVHFEQRQACPSYLTCFAVGNFEKWDGGTHQSEHREIPIAGFALPPFSVQHIERTFRRTAEMLNFLEKRLGVPFPFEKYYQFAAPGIGGAMENISLVSWDERFLLDEELEKEERQLIDIVNVHEMAHSWFGDSVVCRDHSHSWLKEGFATYIESCWLEEKVGPCALAYDLWQCREAYFSEADELYQRPIVTRRYDSSFDLFDRHLYPGSGLRIHQLRLQLGEQTFWAAISDYLQQFAGKVVETDDLRKVLEKHSGQSLAEYFDQWFYEPGFPDLEVKFKFEPELQRGIFEIVQLQANEKTNKGAMRFELEIAFGQEHLGSPQPIAVSQRRTVASFAMSQQPQRVRIDPRGRLLHRLKFDPGVARLTRELTASDPAGRIEAGLLLSSRGTSGVQAIAHAYEKEEQWEIRASFLHSLAKSNCSHARECLIRLGNTEQDARLGAPLYQALGKYRHTSVVTFLVEHLARPLGYRAREAALEALGAQREKAPLDLLSTAASQEQFGGFAQAGALRALGESRHGQAVEILCKALNSNELPAIVKPCAATALGSLASILEKRPRELAIETLVTALQDPNQLVCLAAANALGAAQATESDASLQSLTERLPHQEATRVQRVLQTMRAKNSNVEHKRLTEKLEDRVQQLESQVADLLAKQPNSDN